MKCGQHSIREPCNSICSKVEDPLGRLKHLAEIFHSKADKSVALRKFSAKLRRFKKTPACKYAAHVAAWFAFAPPDYVPGITEIELLHGFLLEVGGGQLPTRLRQILPCAQKVLKRFGPGDLAFEQAREKLQQRLQHFQCCRKGQLASDQSHVTQQTQTSLEAVGHCEKQAAQGCGAVLTSNVASSQVEHYQMRTDAVAVSSESKQSSHMEVALQVPSPSMSGAHHGLFFKKMNEWTNMSGDGKLAFLQQLKQARKAGEKSSESAMADALCALAAALSAPRKSTRSSGSLVDAVDERIGSDVEYSVGGTVNLQHRVRLLLLQLLRDWKARGFDAKLINSILQHIHKQISTFEAQARVLQLF